MASIFAGSGKPSLVSITITVMSCGGLVGHSVTLSRCVGLGAVTHKRAPHAAAIRVTSASAPAAINLPVSPAARLCRLLDGRCIRLLGDEVIDLPIGFYRL